MNDISKLFHYTIRVPKSESAFTYFQLEAREGMCFYSTLPESLGTSYRDLDVKGSLEFKEEFERLIEQLRQEYEIEILLDEVIEDSK